MKKRHILHVVGRMHRGGIETWLIDLIRRMDRERYRNSILVHTNQRQDYDDELESLGCRLFRAGAPKRSVHYPEALARAIQAAGPVDIIHSHEHQFSGVILWVARRLGVPVRIAHCHNDTSMTDRLPNLPRAAYASLMRQAIRRNFTLGLACSEKAAPSMFGAEWRRDQRIGVLHCGLDFDRFEVSVDRQEIRSRLGIPLDRWVIGHVGRLEPQKNHRFMLEIAAALRARASNCHFLFVGDGSLRAALEAEMRDLQLEHMVTLLHARNDIPEILRGAMDCFLFPSLHEGLPLALVEAQAAGLPCLFSSSITAEANVFPGDNRVMDLERPAAQWVWSLLELRRAARPMPASARLPALKRTSLAIDQNVRRLEDVYGSVH